jgi:hypothetical protein
MNEWMNECWHSNKYQCYVVFHQMGTEHGDPGDLWNAGFWFNIDTADRPKKF